MGLMVTVGIVSVRSGQGAARVKGATRDVFAAVRRARSTALVTQQPAIVEYSTVMEDDEPVIKIAVTSAKLMSGEVDLAKVRTISGQPLNIQEQSVADDGQPPDNAKASSGAGEKGGESLEDVLFAPIATDIVKGMRIRVVTEEDGLMNADSVRRPRVSVFSNVDYLLGRYKEKQQKSSAEAKGGASEEKSSETPVLDDSLKPVSVVWETNGRVEPHTIWVYADGQKPEDGLSIQIDRFGAAKVVSGND